jgi:patatin-like phospholipase/acyl hydrolase
MTYMPPRRSDGTLQTRRRPLPWPADRPFRILSIDGGGICGILPASVLAELERCFLGGASIAGYFDMIAGTSTGGIIALGLAHGLSAQDIGKFYVEHGAKIFPPEGPIRRALRSLRRLGRYAYDSAALEDALLSILGEATLGEAKTRLCVPSFEGRHGEPWLYKTPHHPDYQRDRVERMVRVGLATSAAPTFLKALPNNGYVMVDGGLWANNPIMNAVVDALACFDLPDRQIQVLSLGCGETSFKVDDAKATGGLFQWANVFEAAMRAQSMNALGQAYLLLGKPNVLRIDAPESPRRIKLDDHRRACAELPALARSLVEAAGGQVSQIFLQTRAGTFAPCGPAIAAAVQPIGKN